jgi:FtsP/CotA-like multicopper oxidase with cupredoxin domain
MISLIIFSWKYHVFCLISRACQECFSDGKDDCFHPQCITVDGVERGVMSINRMIPGPSIQVCKGDTIVVDLINAAEGSAITIHWHGIHQKNTPFMDGVPYVTQCPILYGTTFRYKFAAAKAGTYFYHSHSGFHKTNGQYGALVIREPQTDDPNAELYQFDLSKHVLLASDWLHTYAENFAPGQPSTAMKIESILLNGRSRHFDGKNYTIAPLSTHRVEKGGKYRFRFINSASLQCPFQVQIEKHAMQVIAADGNAVQPIFVDSLVSLSGERYDFVVNANQEPGEYWIRVRAIDRCEHHKVETFGVLSYSKASQKNDSELAFLERKKPNFEDTFNTGLVSLKRNNIRAIS